MSEVSVPCGTCGKPVRGADDFCEACGASVGPELKRAYGERLAASDSSFAAHRKKIKGAQDTILAVSVLFVLGGIVFFFITRGQVESALDGLASAKASDSLARVVNGATTVGELRAVLERQPWQVLGLNLFLAAGMSALWLWSKRSVLPAIITALGLYVTVQVASALYDPTTLVQGIIMKVLIVAALARGVQSALAGRKLELAR